MAEFAGWIDFTHDLPSGSEAVATMSLGLSAGRAEDARLRTGRGAAFALTRFLPEQIDRGNRLGTATGLDLRFPFCDHRLIEYTLNIPWSMKTFDGREKSILRAATDDLLPRSILEKQRNLALPSGD